MSKALAYSRQVRYLKKRDHANLIRLVKGGYVRVYEVTGSPPPGSLAWEEAPHTNRYYVLAPVEPQT